jgi:hypothetical protein
VSASPPRLRPSGRVIAWTLVLAALALVASQIEIRSREVERRLTGPAAGEPFLAARRTLRRMGISRHSGQALGNFGERHVEVLRCWRLDRCDTDDRSRRHDLRRLLGRKTLRAPGHWHRAQQALGV